MRYFYWNIEIKIQTVNVHNAYVIYPVFSKNMIMNVHLKNNAHWQTPFKMT